MAKMHSRSKGKSGSTKPSKKSKKSWIRYSQKEIEALIVKLAKTDKTASQIGIILRDSYGVPDVRLLTKEKMTKILGRNKLLKELPEDLIALIKKEIVLMKHLESHKKDFPVKRGLQLTESKINRLAKYYKKTGKLPQDWVYDRQKAKILIS